MSWNNQINFPNWAGNTSNAFVLPDNLIVSSIQTNFISTGRINVSTINTNFISSANGNIQNLNASTINTNFISSANGNIQNLNTSTIYTNFISSANGNIKNLNTSSIFTNILNASSISTKTISAQVGYFSTIYVDDIIGLSTSINVISFSTITRSLAVDNISRFEQPFITFNSDVVFKNDFKANAISTHHISSGSISTGSIVADSLKGKISTSEAVIYTTEEVNGTIVFTTPNGDVGGAITGSYDGGLTIFAQNAPMTLLSYDTINILGQKDMLHLISTNYIFSAGATAAFNASNIELNSYNVGISTSLSVVHSTTTDYLFANYISSGSLTTSNINVLDISCNNISVSNTLNVNGPSYLNDGAEINGCTIENVLNMNGNINFPYNTATDPLVLPPNTQPLYDLSYIRNITCGSLYVQGGWSGNEVLPPYHINTLVTIGNDGGITSPAEVVINGQNPGIPGENITNALVVRGDMAVDFGILTTYNGLVCEPFNEEANALEVNGITALNGVANVAGLLTCEGDADIVGILNVTGVAQLTGGANVTGGFLQEGGNFQIGLEASEFNSVINIPLSVNTTTSFNGDVTMNADLDMANHDILNVRNLNVSTITSISANLSTLRLFNLSTNNIILQPDGEFYPTIAFADLSANLNSFIAQVGDSLFINGTSSIFIQAGSNLLMGGAQNAGIVGSTISLTANSNITLFAPESIVIESTDAGVAIDGKNAVALGNQYDTSLFLNLDNMEGFASTSMTFTAGSNFIINANNNLQGGNIFLNNDTIIKSISTNSISTGSLFTSSIRANNISSIFNQVSSMRVQTTLQTSTIQVNRLQTLSDAGGGVITGNLYPVSASAFIGYGSNTAQGGYYQQGTFRSTFTQVIHPSLDSGAFSNIVRIQGTTLCQNVSTNNLITQFLLGAGPIAGTSIYANNLLPNGSAILGNNTTTNSWRAVYANSTFTQVIQPPLDAGVNSNIVRINGNISSQSLIVSTINRKQYPYTSTFGILNSASTFRFNGTDSAVPQILYSNITFPHIGTYLVSGKNSLSKASGGTGAEPHGFFSLSRGLYASTFSVEDGFSSLPFMNRNDISTLNTFTSEIYVSSMNTNSRFITYTDYSAHNYTINFGLAQLRATYIPTQGLNPE
jgi:hypothetical protein